MGNIFTFILYFSTPDHTKRHLGISTSAYKLGYTKDTKKEADTLIPDITAVTETT